MLVGIVTKNAIMLVDFAMVAVAPRLWPAAALMDAGHKRARPIVMTTIAMVAGDAPGALGASATAASFAPHGGRGDRRPRPLDAAVAALCSGHVYHHGRYWMVCAAANEFSRMVFRGMQPITCALRLAFSGHARSGTGA